MLLFSCKTPPKVVIGDANLVQFRLVAKSHDNNITKYQLAKRQEVIKLEAKIHLNRLDIEHAEAFSQDGHNGITIQFTDGGATKLTTLTKKNLRRRLGILVGGRLLTAPTIYAPIEGRVVIVTGNFTRAEAEALAQRINRGK